MSEQEHYTMGWNAGLEAGAALLDLGQRGALRQDVTLAELAEHIRLMKVEREPLNHNSSEVK